MDKAQKKVIGSVEKARQVFEEYVEPGKRDCGEAMNQMGDILDDQNLIEAIDEVKDGRSETERAAGPQPDQHERRTRGPVLDGNARGFERKTASRRQQSRKLG